MVEQPAKAPTSKPKVGLMVILGVWGAGGEGDFGKGPGWEMSWGIEEKDSGMFDQASMEDRAWMCEIR